MPPGQYLPDSTEGITRVEDLPPPRVQRRSYFRRRRCPGCGRPAYRYDLGRRTLHDLGDLRRGRPLDLRVVYSKHRCDRRRHPLRGRPWLRPGPASLATTPTGSSLCPYAWWRRTGYPIGRPPGICGVTTASLFPTPRSRTGSRGGEKKTPTSGGEASHLDWALADFSGYLAVDELYDGPFCVLSAVDSPNQHRLLYEVLDHEPDHDDIRRFLGRLQQGHRGPRGHRLPVITTDGSPLYPEPLAEIFPDVPHQVCEFHVLKELTKAVMHVAARIRKQLKAQAPTLPRGRQPSTPEARRKRRRSQTIKRYVAELFEHRHLFVQHRLTTARRATLRRLSRGEHRLQALRAIMDEVYRLFDRRCRTDTALAKLARLHGKDYGSLPQAGGGAWTSCIRPTWRRR